MYGNENACWICGKNATLVAHGMVHDMYLIECPACGKYYIHEDVKWYLERPAQFNQHARLSAYIRARTIRNMLPVVIVVRRYDGFFKGSPQLTLEEIVSEFPKTLSERLDRSLNNLAKLSPFAGSKFILGGTDGPLLYVETRDHVGEEMQFIAEQLLNEGYIDTHDTVGFPQNYWLTTKGWNRVVELERAVSATTQAFVAMWFNDTVSYEPFRSAIEAAGYKPLRIDQKEHVNQISDEIIAEIRRSKFVVADFTGSRGGVYFEAGFAMGLGLPVIWTCRKGSEADLHFDTRQYNHIFWETEEELQTKLLNRIRAVIV